MLSLVELRQYLQNHAKVTIPQLCHTFNESADFIQQMLDHFIRKGQVTSCPIGGKCHTCTSKCQLHSVMIYE